MEKYFGKQNYSSQKNLGEINTLKGGLSHTMVENFVIRSNLGKVAFINRSCKMLCKAMQYWEVENSLLS